MRIVENVHKKPFYQNRVLQWLFKLDADQNESVEQNCAFKNYPMKAFTHGIRGRRPFWMFSCVFSTDVNLARSFTVRLCALWRK